MLSLNELEVVVRWVLYGRRDDYVDGDGDDDDDVDDEPSWLVSIKTTGYKQTNKQSQHSMYPG